MSLIGLWHDRHLPGRTFEVTGIAQDGYLAVGIAQERGTTEPYAWSCRTALLEQNYVRALATAITRSESGEAS